MKRFRTELGPESNIKHRPSNRVRAEPVRFEPGHAPAHTHVNQSLQYASPRTRSRLRYDCESRDRQALLSAQWQDVLFLLRTLRREIQGRPNQIPSTIDSTQIIGINHPGRSQDVPAANHRLRLPHVPRSPGA
jgi:hypothetical protein